MRIMKKIGITGQAGFVGTHLYHHLGLLEDVERVPFEDAFFEDDVKLQAFVSSCDAIVHLAAMNRHEDEQVIYDTNIRLVKQLIGACEATASTPHILFSSSTQEENEGIYGQSKREGRLLFEAWAQEQSASFTGLVIPNVFGPFGRPFYNSFVATFCHLLVHEGQPEVKVDAEVGLIYVGNLVKLIIERIINPQQGIERYVLPIDKRIKVTQVLVLLEDYRVKYLLNGVFPDLSDVFECNLFNTFVTYIDHKTYFPRPLTPHADDRGVFVETSKVHGGQNSFSTTVPGITRGNHYHTRKAERFTVIKGKAKLELRRIGTDEVLEFVIDGDDCPGYVDMPIWYTHNITNVGDTDLYTVFWISEHYDAEDGDTYFEKV